MIVSELAITNRSPETDEGIKLGRHFKLLNESRLEEYSIVFIGRDGPPLSNIALTFLGMLQEVHFIENRILILGTHEAM